MENLNFTGERLVTNLDSSFGIYEHLHRYALALEICKGKRVLDIASGEGYGSNLIAEFASQVIGVDISNEAIVHAAKKYNKPNLTFKVGSVESIPLANDSVDVVVSFETLEHHDKHDEMMIEILRVLTPGGVLLISSPEASIYYERDPNNPFHIKEITAMEFEKLTGKYFKNVSLYKQRIVIGSLISNCNADLIFNKFLEYDGDFSTIKNKLTEQDFFNKPFFNLILCSNDDSYSNLIPDVSIFSAYSVYASLYQEFEDKVRIVKNSRSYRIGNILVRPFVFLKSLLKKSQ